TNPPSVTSVTPSVAKYLSSKLGRRKIIQLAGLGSMVAVGAIAYDRLIKDIIFPGSGNGDKSPTTNLSLQSFDFNVITLDSQGREATRNRRSANFFPQDLGNGITLEMVAIPGGTFTMGSPTSEAERWDNESPQHSVTISPFYMGKYTVTQAQWRVVAALPKVNRDLSSDPSRFKGDNLPVEKITWLDATEFCARLSKYTGRNYRLPTEAEWEYACRAGTNTPFHFGETINTDCVNYNGNYPYGSAPKGEDRQKTTPVGSFQVANNFGLYDMHGNVWEWCQDYYHGGYQNAPSDGSTNENNSQYRLLRGGSWIILGRYCRSANRNRYEPDFRDNFIGFRLVVS
ncbi:formylglycine-generating enzyme family protein, partial [Limnofasciculus baicalensis]